MEVFRSLTEQVLDHNYGTIHKAAKKKKGGKWNESLHPREKAGSSKGGQFTASSSSTGGKKLPKWKRDNRYNGWVRSLSPEEQETLARTFYEKLWAQLQAYFGDVGQPPPELIFTENLPESIRALTFNDGTGLRQVQMRPTDMLMMALRGQVPRESVTTVVVHEWRHIFQNAALWHIGRDQPHDTQPMEQDANAFAVRVMKTMRKNRKRKRKHKPLIQPTPYNPWNISENIGKNPTTIPYPGYEASV